MASFAWTWSSAGRSAAETLGLEVVDDLGRDAHDIIAFVSAQDEFDALVKSVENGVPCAAIVSLGLPEVMVAQLTRLGPIVHVGVPTTEGLADLLKGVGGANPAEADALAAIEAAFRTKRSN